MRATCRPRARHGLPERGRPGDRRGRSHPRQPLPGTREAWPQRVGWLPCLTCLPCADQTGSRASRAPTKLIRRRLENCAVKVSIPYIQEAAFRRVNRGRREDIPRGPATYRSPVRFRHRTLEPPPEDRWNQRVTSVAIGCGSDRRRSGAAVQPSLRESYGANEEPGGSTARRGLRVSTLANQVARPFCHQPLPPLEQVRPPIGRLDRVPDHMRQRSLRHLARMVRLLGRPVPKTRAEAVRRGRAPSGD